MIQPDRHSLGAMLDEARDAAGIVGAVAGIRRDTDVVIAASGVANLRTGTAVTEDTRFLVGSISKTLTAAAILVQVDAGRLDLDDPVTRHLPEFSLGGDAGPSRSITVRHLLTHTAGVKNCNFEDFGREDGCLGRFVADCRRFGPVHPPGALFSYSNGGYSVLGRVIEVLTGQPYYRAMRELVLEPLGMADSTYLAEEAILNAVAVGHRRDPQSGVRSAVGTYRSNSAATAPEGGLITTVSDLLRYAVRVTRPAKRGGLLSASSLAEMLRVQAPVPDIYPRPGWGLGWAIATTEPLRVEHAGGIGGQEAHLLVLPDEGTAVALLTNSDGDVKAVRDTLIAATVGETPARPTDAARDVPPVAPSRYVGVYRQGDDHWAISERDGSLHAEMRWGASMRREGASDEADLRLEPVAMDTFRVAGTGGRFIRFLVADGDDGPIEYLHEALVAFRRAR